MARTLSTKNSSPAEAKKKTRGRVDAIAEAMGSFRSAREVFAPVRAVRTRMVQFDYVTRCGGYPIEVVGVGHGPSNHGKTAFALILAGSFLDRGHFVLHVDAERTTPIDWARKMIGERADDETYFKAFRPDTYEETVAHVRKFLLAVKGLRDAKHVTDDTSAIVIVDSLRKLVPKNFFDQVTRDDGNPDAARGRGPMIKAKWNTAWMDELTPLLDNAKAGFFGIGREHHRVDASEMDKKYGKDIELGGGGALVFDSALIVRIDRSSWVKDKGEDGREADEDMKNATIFGEQHRITVKKTKIGAKDGRTSVAYFHTSNGKLDGTPEGHDRARDVLDLGMRLGIVERSGSWLSWGERSLGQGKNKSVQALYASPEMLEELEEDCRALFVNKPPVEHDEETGVIT